MNNPHLPLQVKADPTNPGQVFACCGLLEIADRLWSGAEGWFTDGLFNLQALHPQSHFSANQLLNEFMKCKLTNTMTGLEWSRLHELSKLNSKEREKIPGLEEERKALDKLRRESPIVFGQNLDMRIDWFLDKRAGGARFKTWAGQQSVLEIATAMKAAISPDQWANSLIEKNLTQTTGDEGLPFYFDSDFGSQASSIDAGFSMDTLGIRSRTRPLIELAAFIGLQRFRPLASTDKQRYRFVLWSDPLPPEVASAACSGMIPQPDARSFEFRLLYRTDYLKSFLPAILSTRGDQ